MTIKYWLNDVFFPLFEGEAGDTGDGGDGGAGDAGAASAAGTPPKTFTQEEVNRFLAAEKRKQQEQNDKTVKELQALKQAKGLTDQEKASLEDRIKALQSEGLTKEQLLQKEKEKIKTELNEQLESSRKETQVWKERFVNQKIVQEINSAASSNGAFDSEQILALLFPKTSVVETLDDEGKPTGEYNPRVKLADVTADGKPTTLDLSVPEAVKLMKGKPDKYGNLFKSTASGGLGLGGTSQSKDPDWAGLVNDPAKYRELRKKGKEPK